MNMYEPKQDNPSTKFLGNLPNMTQNLILNAKVYPNLNQMQK